MVIYVFGNGKFRVEVPKQISLEQAEKVLETAKENQWITPEKDSRHTIDLFGQSWEVVIINNPTHCHISLEAQC